MGFHTLKKYENSMADILDFIRRTKQVKKEAPKQIKQTIEETDFKGTFFEALSKVTNSKKFPKIIIIASILIVIITGLLIFNSYMNRLNGPTVNKLKILNSSYGDITYTGEIKNGTIYGKGILSIIGNEWAIEYNGNFLSPDRSNEENSVNIGNFYQGEMTILNRKSGNKYIYNGTFEDNELIEGFIEKNFGNSKVIYTGNFKNNKLCGTGTKYIEIDGKHQTIDGIFVDGEVKNITEIKN